MSPADRVFGLVGKRGGYRGQLRLRPARCQRSDAIPEFRSDGGDLASIPLAILAQPKPQQVRFYVAQSGAGEAAKDGEGDREAVGYRNGKGLRGRKVYPHHPHLPPRYWNDPHVDRTQQQVRGYFQEYRRPNAFDDPGNGKPHQDGNKPFWKLTNQPTRDDQNRSVLSWVKPETKFTFTIDVTNLSRVELGALLWLLDLNRQENDKAAIPRAFFHRLGGGKPLGFGSVKLEIDWQNTDLRCGNEWRDYYLSLDESPAQPTPEKANTPQSCIKDFKEAVFEAYPGSGKDFRSVPFIAAFLRAAEGFTDGLPIHYPRTQPKNWLGEDDPVPPHPEGKSYEWFVANERTGRDGGDKLSLPDLVTDAGLRFYRSSD